jgi:hypothetical protein
MPLMSKDFDKNCDTKLDYIYGYSAAMQKPEIALSDSEKLANYVRSLLDFEMYLTIDGNYDHIGATVADAAL